MNKLYVIVMSRLSFESQVKLYSPCSNHSQWKKYNANHFRQVPKHPIPGIHNNRFYHRGSTPSGIAPYSEYAQFKEPTKVDPDLFCRTCSPKDLHFNKRNAHKVLSSNNPYAEDNPPFPDHVVFSIFGDRALTRRDLDQSLSWYNEGIADTRAEEKYGPFSHFNYNIAGESGLNQRSWNTSWKEYDSNYFFKKKKDHSVNPLLKIVRTMAIRFKDAMNTAFWSEQVAGNIFHLGKYRLRSIRRSPQTGYLKYDLQVGLVRETQAQATFFDVLVYLNPKTSRITLGLAHYAGRTTTDKILLPQGHDKHLYSGRPLHPVYSKLSEIPSEKEVEKQFWQIIHKQRTPKQYHFEQKDPYWYQTRKPNPKHWKRAQFHPTSLGGLYYPYS